MQSVWNLEGRTVLIAGAGGPAGGDVVRAFSDGGARVVALDRDEPAVLALARAAPRRVEPLALDPMRPAPCRLLGEVWADSPLHALVHLQALAVPARPGTAIQSVAALTRALGPALVAGSGRVVIAHAAAGADAPAEASAFAPAFARLATGLDATGPWPAGRVNAVCLPPCALSGAPPAAARHAMLFLASDLADGIGGGILRVVPGAC
ncbi:hypothetical protein [Roseovarius salinarum]|uniref:hypothetical protein n=1 Tax=Roseovarius salinarum TaxID=1981892 RepID=UPI000C33369A|nr:hypothetical protein [Roseovarius salinarum]